MPKAIAIVLGGLAVAVVGARLAPEHQLMANRFQECRNGLGRGGFRRDWLMKGARRVQTGDAKVPFQFVI